MAELYPLPTVSVFLDKKVLPASCSIEVKRIQDRCFALVTCEVQKGLEIDLGSTIRDRKAISLSVFSFGKVLCSKGHITWDEFKRGSPDQVLYTFHFEGTWAEWKEMSDDQRKLFDEGFHPRKKGK